MFAKNTNDYKINVKITRPSWTSIEPIWPNSQMSSSTVGQVCKLPMRRLLPSELNLIEQWSKKYKRGY
jgi:hypothetical protein